MERCEKYCGMATVVYCPCVSTMKRQADGGGGTVVLGSQPTCGTAGPGDGDLAPPNTPKLPGLSGSDTIVIVGASAAALLCAGACCLIGCRGARSRSGEKSKGSSSLRKMQRSSSRSRSVGRLETASLYDASGPGATTHPAATAAGVYATGTYTPGAPTPKSTNRSRTSSTSASRKVAPARPVAGPAAPTLTPKRPVGPPSIRVEAPPRPTLRPLTDEEKRERDAEVERRAARLATRPSRQRLAGTTTSDGITYSDLPPGAAGAVATTDHYTEMPPPSNHYGSLRLASRSTSRGRIARRVSGTYA